MTSKICAGKLTEPVALYQSVNGVSDMGAPIKGIRLQSKTWAELLQTTNETTTTNDVDKFVQQFQFRLRWRDGVSVGGWLNWRKKWHKIIAINESDIFRNKLVIDVVRDVNPPSIQGLSHVG